MPSAASIVDLRVAKPVIRVTGSVVVAAVCEPPHEFSPALTKRRYRFKQEIVHRAGIEPATQ